MDVVFFETPDHFRAWLEENHATASELQVGYYKKGSGRPSMTWPESVDQALCFGWIDSIRRRIDDESYTNRFTPRRPGSNWSLVNIRRVQELIELGMMHPAGLAAFEARDPAKSEEYSYENRPQGLAEPYETGLRANPAAWEYWTAQPPHYRRGSAHWVMSAKREETRQKRLATLIADSAAGQWIALYRRTTD
ncbi:MAG: YdeI/OmpD-associated family protein [Anaerolineae bacterium]|nr:YdeI/OmpD-associated family protein [Anaerolineae bacterium]